jgi:hypothetical protein
MVEVKWSDFLATDTEVRVRFPALSQYNFKYYLERNDRLCGLVVRVPGYG